MHLEETEDARLRTVKDTSGPKGSGWMRVIPGDLFESEADMVQYEPGDRVVLLKDHYIGEWMTDKAGSHATVVRVSKGRPPVAFLDIQTDTSKAGGYGTIHVAPWDITLEECQVKAGTKMWDQERQEWVEPPSSQE